MPRLKSAVSETAMREFCHRHQIRPYRPTYRYLRGDPQRQAATKAEAAAQAERAIDRALALKKLRLVKSCGSRHP